jgi:putative chitinase
MPVKFNVDEAMMLIEDHYKTKSPPEKLIFSGSLRLVLENVQVDTRINDIREVAYLLGTAAEESFYSLQRWEADFVCVKPGTPYGASGPCQKALNYYRSLTGGKVNYYTLGVDSKGLPYFGRGLIQLTGKGNYEYFGDIIGVDLVNNGDLALEENNSYNVAIEYMSRILPGKKDSTFGYAKNGDLTKARKTVNAGLKGLANINQYYNIWLGILNKTKISDVIVKTQGTIVSGATNEPIKGVIVKIQEPLPKAPILNPQIIPQNTNLL